MLRERAIATPLSRSDSEWRRSLTGLWIATAAGVFGSTFATPFIPLFLARDLGISNPRELALWSGLAPAALGAGLAISSPIWGMVADRVGLKAMLVRAMLGGSVALALTSLAHNPVQVTLFMLLYGAIAGFSPLAVALVAKESSRARVGFGIGIVQSANAMGQSAGPFVGSLAAIIVGLRSTFLLGGSLILLAVVPVLSLVRESSRSSHRTQPPRVLLAVRTAPGTLHALVALLSCQALIWASVSAAQPLVALRLLALTPTMATVLIGITFGLAGIITAISALTYSRLVSRLGYRWLVTASSLLGALTLLVLALVPSVAVIVVGFAIFGLTRGVLIPALPSMIGLEAPPSVLATVMGASGSAMAIGIVVGPVVGGSLAAAASLQVALIAAAGLSAILTMVVTVFVREPAG